MIYRLNQTLQDVYSSFKIPVADVASAFSLGASHSANLHKISDSTPQSSAVCTLTWMCVPAPFGPNVHPDDAGYRVIAKAIEAVLPPLS
jgi:lysophospholipase L1-like esterase